MNYPPPLLTSLFYRGSTGFAWTITPGPCPVRSLRPPCKNGGVQSPARRKLALDHAPLRLHRNHNISQHFIDCILVKDPQVAVSQQIHFQRLQLDTSFARLVLNRDYSVIWD